MEFTIRHVEPDDTEAIYRILHGPNVIAGTLRLPFTSRELVRERFTRPDPGAYLLAACHAEEVVGTLGLRVASNPRRRHAGELGMMVDDAWHGRGAGSALMRAAIDLADNWLNLHRLEIYVYTDNEPALALYRKFGFEIEGTLKQYAYRDGAYVDAYAMARVRARS